MIYLRIKIYHPGVDELLDFLGTQLKLKFDWTPNKREIFIAVEDEQDLEGFEAFITHVYEGAIEWEYHDDEDNIRYIAQRRENYVNYIDKQYLIPFKENIDFMKGQ